MSQCNFVNALESHVHVLSIDVCKPFVCTECVGIDAGDDTTMR